MSSSSSTHGDPGYAEKNIRDLLYTLLAQGGGGGGVTDHALLTNVLATQHHDNANDPNAGQKAALAGTNGAPGSGNPFVTNSDPRNADPRTPTAHSHAGAGFGTNANRPAAGNAGYLYRTTDDPKGLWQDDGATWVLVAPTPTYLRDGGSSASGVAGTKVAEILAAAGTKLVNWTVFFGQLSAATSQVRLVVTYSDTTTDTLTSSGPTNAFSLFANWGGGLQQTVAASADFQTKDVVGLRVETVGTGTGSRVGKIAAAMVPA